MNKLIIEVFATTKGRLARNTTEIAVKWLQTDLDKKGFLQKTDGH